MPFISDAASVLESSFLHEENPASPDSSDSCPEWLRNFNFRLFRFARFGGCKPGFSLLEDHSSRILALRPLPPRAMALAMLLPCDSLSTFATWRGEQAHKRYGTENENKIGFTLATCCETQYTVLQEQIDTRDRNNRRSGPAQKNPHSCTRRPNVERMNTQKNDTEQTTNLSNSQTQRITLIHGRR